MALADTILGVIGTVAVLATVCLAYLTLGKARETVDEPKAARLDAKHAARDAADERRAPAEDRQQAAANRREAVAERRREERHRQRRRLERGAIPPVPRS
jgi:biopolymer transport protein ExbB/TolQ